MRRLTAILLSFFFCAAAGQSLTREEIQRASLQQLPVVLEELKQFLLLPNDAHQPSQTKVNVDWCLQSLNRRGFMVTALAVDSVPYVFAEKIFNRRLPTVLFYVQIDGQPVDQAAWNQDDPYRAVLKSLVGETWRTVDWTEQFDPESRIFARSVSDSKGPAMAFLAALDILVTKRIKPTCNVKIIMDFQEELGSPTLPLLVDRYRDLFKSRMVLIMDGTRHVSNLPTLNFGARGIATVTLKVFGAASELHSGQYGNYAPNPVFQLARLLGGMKDESGVVTIPGFYEGVSLSASEKMHINDMPGSDTDLNKRLGIALPDQVGDTYEESLQYPSLNVRGVLAASVGDEVRTIIPAEAVAEIDMRLVPETPGERQVNLLKNYIAAEGYHFVTGIPTPEERATYTKLISFEYRLGSKPFRTDLESAEGIWLSQAMDRTFGKGMYVKQRTTGGSQPIEPFITTLGIPAVSVRIPNPDNNIHAANENLRIGNFLEGIEMCLGILTEPMR